MLTLLMKTRRLAQFLSAVLALTVVAGCAGLPTTGDRLPTARGNTVAAQSAEARQDWPKAAAEWLALAAKAGEAEAAGFRLSALSALLNANDVLRARVIHDDIPTELLSASQTELLAVLHGDLLVQEGRPAEALVVLPLSLSASAPSDLQARFLLVRGVAFAEQGALVSAIEDFTASDQWLAPGEGRDWQRTLWPVLVGADEQVLRKALRRHSSVAVEGWLRLGLIGQQEWLQPERFEQQLDGWESRFRLHAANADLVPALRESHRLRQFYPNSVAVLLPLSGRYAAIGEAVRDGLLAAWFALPGDRAGGLKFFDTEAELPLQWLRQQPLGEWAVVGPLRKEKVQELAKAKVMQSLSWLPLNQSAPEGAAAQLALALSPEQEAALAAERMGRDGYRRALVIAAHGDWGQRVADAFAERFTATGGKVVGLERYDGGQADHGDTIQRALLLNQSEQRRARMERVLGRNVNFEPRRRNDVDAVFAPGKPRALRALRPQLKFYRAGGVPVYATSHVWQGKVNPSADLDLNGVRFADMPWHLGPSTTDKALRKAISRAGGRDTHGRFHALGADAIRVLPLLAGGDGGFPWVFPGGTGLLQPGNDGLVERRLMWAEFKKGRPVLIPAAQWDAGS
jgi:outer membrane PBP1 activator LpoA protein